MDLSPPPANRPIGYEKNKLSIHPFRWMGLLALSVVLTVSACRKADLEAETNDKFDVAAAKEWWYGTFVKSSEYLGTVVSESKRNKNRSATARALTAASVATNNKLPSWKRGRTFTIGRLKIVELPLVMSHRVLYLPIRSGETDADRLKVAENSLHKLIIVQKADGSLVTRIVTIIPSLHYLAKMQFNLSGLSLEHIPVDFEGIINVADWNESQVANWLYKQGKRKRVKIELGQPNERGRRKLVREVPCPPEYGIVGYHKFCIDVGGSDDEPSNYCDNPENWKIGAPIYGYYIPDGPCYEEDNTGDPCANMTAEQCSCMMFGIGCDGGDGGGDDGYGDTTKCDLDEAEAQEILNGIGGTQLHEVSSEDGAIESGGEYEGAKIRRVSDRHWSFLRTPILSRDYTYVADYAGVKYKNTMEDPTWKWETFSYTGWRRVGGVTFIPCIKIEEQVNSGSVMIFSDKSKAIANMNYSIIVSIECSVGIRAADPISGSTSHTFYSDAEF